MTTIVIADDHAVMRSGLRMLLVAADDLDVVVEAEDVAENIRAELVKYALEHGTVRA